MCGITGIISKAKDNNVTLTNDLYVSLMNIQHRGQDSCGYLINNDNENTIFKGTGLVKNNISYDELSKIPGNIAIGHVRYPTTSGKTDGENQPFSCKTKTNLNISIVHNGNVYNYEDIKKKLISNGYIFKSDSDTEVLLNYICCKIDEYYNDTKKTDIFKELPDILSKILIDLYRNISGSYSVLLLIENFGLIAFCDKYAIKPLIYGDNNYNYLFVSESIALDVLGYSKLGDIKPGEVYIVRNNINIENVNYNTGSILVSSSGLKYDGSGLDIRPCMFEYVYFARPESIIHNISVYEARTNMGYYLASKIRKELSTEELTEVAAIIPVPDTSTISACKLSEELNIPIKFGIIKNRYIDRTFIMKNNATRTNNIRQKLFIVKQEVYNKNIIIVDDSIVRGNTCFHIVKELRNAGAKKIYFSSCCPQIRYKNVYGIDIPMATELVAHNRTDDEIAKCIGADKVIYQELNDLKKSVINTYGNINNIKDFELSVFNGEYIT